MTASSAAASSIDDVLAEVLWVNSITDPSLCIDSLHEAFLKVVFSFPSAASAEEEDAPTTQIRTAAQRERDARRKAELRREMDELLAPVEEASVGSREGVRDDDDESFDDEEAELDEDAAEVNDFMNWIERGARPSATAAQSQRPTTVKATELELHKVGLGAAQQSSAMDPLPDRYKEIEIRERRPQLGSKELAGEVYSYKIPLEHEAYWILRQLRLSGQPLAHNTRIAELANTSRGECADAPVIVAITYALQKMVAEHLEPAHLMLYHQSALHPLLFALLEDSPLMESAEHTLPAPSFAYSLVTGRRQRPYMSERYVGFTAQVEDGSIGDGDPLWHRSASSEYAQRKPCFIELGRLLVRILELDCLCHRLEHRRQRLLVALKDDPEARVQDQRAMLEATVFESVVQADIWQSFVELLTNRRSRGSYNRVHALGIEDVFEEYSITGLQYQENLLANAPVNMCPPQQGNLREWANTVGSRVQPAMSGEAILSLFNNAIVEQFSQLPILSKMIFDLFCSEGDLIVSYQWIQRPDEVFSLASFFVEHPQQYLDLVHMERQRTVNLFYVLDETLVRRALNVGQLYHRNQNDEWCREREVAIDILIINLMDSIIPRVKAELSRQAQLHMDWSSVQRFGLLCAQGPYEPTRLCLERFNDASVTWPPQWNVVEALPTEVAATGWGTRPRSRVCAAYRSDKNGVTAFAFIDENGTTVGSTRWNDCDLKTPSGRAADLTQRIKLESLFLQCCPTVIAVGATDPAALDLMRSLQLFTRDRIFPALQVDIPIVWVSPEVARFCSSTDFANAEYSSSATTDSLMRVSIYLARYLQDPLTALCLLFDSKRTALRLCRSGGENISHEHAAELYARLRWELSLWITATGVWLDDLVKRPNAAAMLQFVAGLGDAKARVLMQKLLPVVPNSRADMQMLLEGVFGPCVAQNAVSSIRIRAPDWSTVDAECSWHPLDHTLIPLDWYEIASFAAAEALRTSGGPQGEGALPIVQLANKLPIEKRRLIDERADQQSLIKKIADLNRAEWLSLRGERELELILEELVAMGHSSLRRPYRRISTRELMTCMTSMVYLTAEESAVQSLARTSATGGTSIVREGEYVEGTVSDVFAGKSPGIRVSTSRGLNAFIRPSDIPDEMTRQTLLDYVKLLLLQREARKLGQSVADRPRAPQWLQRGANIQGVVTGCNWGKCELFLRWCRPREAESEGASPSGAANILSYAALVREAASSSANSLKTAEIENEATVFTTKISRHPLFRDVPNTKANELLRDKEIGEVLLRPARRRRHHAVCVVKVGLNCTCNWIISEERRSNGTLYYRLEDRLLGRTVEYEEVDEFLRNFIAPMIAKVMTIRQHRRFQENEEDVTTSLAEQEQSGNGFAYCFTETSRNSLPPLYRVITRGGGFRHKFDLHISDTAIYVRLPIRGEDDTASFDWVECRNAEHVSEVLKCKAMQDR